MASLLRFHAGSKWKRRPKESKRTESPRNKEEQLQSSWRVGEMRVEVYAAKRAQQLPTQEEPPLHHHHHDFLHLHCEVEFDPEKDYAQVLEEARSHLKVTSTSDANTASRTHTRPPQHHLDAYKELHSKLGNRNKSSKLWRYFFFWRKPSSMVSEKQVEAEFESIFSSPPHPSSKTRRPTRKEATGKSFVGRPTRTNNSGPLYTDGLPVGPFNIKHTKKSYSGPLGPSSGNNVDSHMSPYQLLYKPPSSSPLYSCE